MIRIDGLNFAVGNFALKDVSLHVKPGEYFVLLGPSGSGKTLLVECLCGVNRIASGRIYIGGVDVTDREPRHRGVGYVPQDYALFPDQTVRGNVAFGEGDPLLRHVSRLPRRIQRLAGYLFYVVFILLVRPLVRLARRLIRIRRERPVSPQTAQLMKIVGVTHLADRFPGKLSGGEKQRVALGRALAVAPRVLLLDEPVSALDEQTRDTLCGELKQLQRSTQTTTIHVCHNFAEMLMVADRVGIIRDGRILQVGTPQEILQRPRSTQVARFVQAGNLLPAVAQTDGEYIGLGCTGDIQLRAARPDSGTVTGKVIAMVRPEYIHLAASRPENLAPETTLLEGSVSGVVDLGPVVKLTVACGPDAELTVLMGKKEYDHRRFDAGDRVHLAIAPENVHVMQQ